MSRTAYTPKHLRNTALAGMLNRNGEYKHWLHLWGLSWTANGRDDDQRASPHITPMYSFPWTCPFGAKAPTMLDLKALWAVTEFRGLPSVWQERDLWLGPIKDSPKEPGYSVAHWDYGAIWRDCHYIRLTDRRPTRGTYATLLTLKRQVRARHPAWSSEARKEFYQLMSRYLIDKPQEEML